MSSISFIVWRGWIHWRSECRNPDGGANGSAGHQAPAPSGEASGNHRPEGDPCLGPRRPAGGHFRTVFHPGEPDGHRACRADRADAQCHELPPAGTAEVGHRGARRHRRGCPGAALEGRRHRFHHPLAAGEWPARNSPSWTSSSTPTAAGSSAYARPATTGARAATPPTAVLGGAGQQSAVPDAGPARPN